MGVRLRYEPKDIQTLFNEFVISQKKLKDILREISNTEKDNLHNSNIFPHTMTEFLLKDNNLNSLFGTKSYLLDPQFQKEQPPQALPDNAASLDDNPLKGLIKIDFIGAQRGFYDANDSERNRNRLSIQLQDYFKKHLDPTKAPKPEDIYAIQAIDNAKSIYDKTLKTALATPLKALSELGYPGISNPEISITSKIKPIDGLDHNTAIQYKVKNSNDDDLKLPEDYNGLGYQNLISMAFKLMRFRDDWMRVGKAQDEDKSDRELLHLVIIEEPEAHLHPQAQQVFVREAHKLLRENELLGDKKQFSTQLIMSTHSSHIAHECHFSKIRYFKRLPVGEINLIPTVDIINLTTIFGDKNKAQRFATRYIRTTHCDIFFADAVILIEGAAERMLLPTFIETNFEKLRPCYISILEIGGNYAFRLEKLIYLLGIPTLVITDLDAYEIKDSNNRGKKTRAKVRPERNKELKTSNPTLIKWLKKHSIDDLIKLTEETKKDEKLVHFAYQTPIMVNFNSQEKEIIPYTFEDALVFENIKFFEELTGTGFISKIRTALSKAPSHDLLAQQLFDDLKNANKGDFALELFMQKEIKLTPPKYIKEGLSWLEQQVATNFKENC